MTAQLWPQMSSEPAVNRLAGLAPLDQAAQAALAIALRRRRQEKARKELIIEGSAIPEPWLFLSGWAARVRQLEDGRRQIMSFFLPGDLIGNCQHERPAAVSTVIAVTPVEICRAPSPNLSRSLKEAYAVSGALEEGYLLSHIIRLGRLSAEERLADLFLELFERSRLAGLEQNGSFPMPLTQEMLADATGLTAVHVNRMLQQLRGHGDIVFKSNCLTIVDPAALAHRIGRSPVVVQAG